MTVVTALPLAIVFNVCDIVASPERSHVVRDSIELVATPDTGVLTVQGLVFEFQCFGDADAMREFTDTATTALESLQVNNQEFRQLLQTALVFKRVTFALHTGLTADLFLFKLLLEPVFETA
eukprot:CAMPEP_0116891540 /NCGR_PEP_ID=MMETSP0467-20121206/1926_1 /TAXON_ID=283647 /ORGANISM="Mesodinium pulex, Strain SPMC105" /LENGTH=121 /DNA_ID=CAMNT_0004560097 /DNA_START=205 /DNA_END=570 /DNA_ORIENTATION=-